MYIEHIALWTPDLDWMARSGPVMVMIGPFFEKLGIDKR